MASCPTAHLIDPTAESAAIESVYSAYSLISSAQDRPLTVDISDEIPSILEFLKYYLTLQYHAFDPQVFVCDVVAWNYPPKINSDNCFFEVYNINPINEKFKEFV
jgi:hypothetical protein